MNRFLTFLAASMLFVGCSQYQKAIKSEDPEVKLAAATIQYGKGKYAKAIKLFEQIAPAYRGKASAEDMFYMYAQSQYQLEHYNLSGYQFEGFAAGYPRSSRAEEASFLSAKSYAQLSPRYSLDQTDTYKAVNKLQAFIDANPNSGYMVEANATLKILTEKLEKKAFEIAKGYNTTSDFKSAIVSLDNFISDYPGTKYKEEALFLRLDSAYKLAINSVSSKMVERLLVARTSYSTLMKFNDASTFKPKADAMLIVIDRDLQKYTNQ